MRTIIAFAALFAAVGAQTTNMKPDESVADMFGIGGSSVAVGSMLSKLKTLPSGGRFPLPSGIELPSFSPTKCDCPGGQSSAMCDCPKFGLPPGLSSLASPLDAVTKMASWSRPRPVRGPLPTGCPNWLDNTPATRQHINSAMASSRQSLSQSVQQFMGALPASFPKPIKTAIYVASLIAELALKYLPVGPVVQKAVDIAKKIASFVGTTVASNKMQNGMTSAGTNCLRPLPQPGMGRSMNFVASLAPGGGGLASLTSKLNTMTGLPLKNIKTRFLPGFRRSDGSGRVAISFEGENAGYASSVLDYMDDGEHADDLNISDLGAVPVEGSRGTSDKGEMSISPAPVVQSSRSAGHPSWALPAVLTVTVALFAV